MRVSTLHIAWRNLGRNRKRTTLALLAVTVGQFALLATNSLMHGYTDNIRRAITGPMVGHVQIHHPDWREERAMDQQIANLAKAQTAIAQETGVKTVAPRIYSSVLMAPKRDGYAATVVGIDINAESSDYGLLSGLEGETAPEKHEVLIGYILARRSRARPGQEIAIVGQAADGSFAADLYTVKGIIRSPSSLVNESGVVMPLTEAQRLFVMPNAAHELVIRAESGTESRPLAQQLRKLSALHGLEVTPWREIVPELVTVLEMSDHVGYFVIALVFVAAIAGIANTMMMSTFERLHEFGMLLALGGRPRRLVKMIIIESLLLGVLGVLIGTVVGYVFVFVFHGQGIDMASWGGSRAVEDLTFQGLRLPLRIHPRLEITDTIAGLIAVMVTALVAALWPAAHAARLEPMEAMRS